MKNLTALRPLFRTGLTLACALALWSPARAQTSEPSGAKMKMEDKMMEDCQEMKAHKEKMMAEMKAEDAALTAQVAAMNNASESKKPGLMAAIVTTMLEQRIARDAHKAKMEEKMMKHMMQHMQAKEGMSACPMMKEMHDKTEAMPKMSK